MLTYQTVIANLNDNPAAITHSLVEMGVLEEDNKLEWHQTTEDEKCGLVACIFQTMDVIELGCELNNIFAAYVLVMIKQNSNKPERAKAVKSLLFHLLEHHKIDPDNPQRESLDTLFKAANRLVKQLAKENTQSYANN